MTLLLLSGSVVQRFGAWIKGVVVVLVVVAEAVVIAAMVAVAEAVTRRA